MSTNPPLNAHIISSALLLIVIAVVSILIHPFLVEQIFSTKIFLASLKKLHVVHVGLHTFTGSICCISQGSLVIKVKKKIWEKKDQPWLKNKKSA